MSTAKRLLSLTGRKEFQNPSGINRLVENNLPGHELEEIAVVSHGEKRNRCWCFFVSFIFNLFSFAFHSYLIYFIFKNGQDDQLFLARLMVSKPKSF